MKIKSDFVTNSSSTSYVVYIPEGTSFERLSISDRLKFRVYELIEQTDGDEVVKTEDEIKAGMNELKKVYNDFVKNGNYYDYDNYTKYTILEELLGENKLVILSMDTCSDGGSITLLKGRDMDKIEEINRRMS